MSRGVTWSKGFGDPRAIGVDSDQAAGLFLRVFDFIHLNPRADHSSDNRTSTAELEAAFYCWNNFSSIQTAGLVQLKTVD